MSEETELVQKPAIELLKNHPKVAFVIRANSGSKGYVKFFYAYGIEKLPDIIGMLTDGTWFSFECKKPDWKGVNGTSNTATAIREREQRDTLETISNNGGVAEFICSPEQCEWAIKSHFMVLTYGS